MARLPKTKPLLFTSSLLFPAALNSSRESEQPQRALEASTMLLQRLGMLFHPPLLRGPELSLTEFKQLLKNCYASLVVHVRRRCARFQLVGVFLKCLFSII